MKTFEDVKKWLDSISTLVEDYEYVECPVIGDDVIPEWADLHDYYASGCYHSSMLDVGTRNGS